MLTNLRKNCLGTVCFDGKFDGMRKAQDFDVYPLQAEDDATKLRIQSDTRFGLIFLDDGRIFMSPSIAGGARTAHLQQGKFLTPLTAEELVLLKSHVMASASGKAGTRGVFVDNTNALDVFQSTKAGNPPQ